jgi:predicted enzyme related to lactoylglutathione lyase
VGRRVVHFEVVARGNVEELAKFYADTFEWNVSDTNNPFNTES